MPSRPQQNCCHAIGSSALEHSPTIDDPVWTASKRAHRRFVSMHIEMAMSRNARLRRGISPICPNRADCRFVSLPYRHFSSRSDPFGTMTFPFLLLLLLLCGSSRNHPAVYDGGIRVESGNAIPSGEMVGFASWATGRAIFASKAHPPLAEISETLNTVMLSAVAPQRHEVEAPSGEEVPGLSDTGPNQDALFLSVAKSGPSLRSE